MKPIAMICSVLLMAVALAHAARLLMGIPMTVGSVDIPMWPSVLGVIVPGALSILLWRENSA